MAFNNLKYLQHSLNYFFIDLNLLKLALTHSSANVNNYERLEFVGDSILDYVIANLLYKKYPFATEGDLSKMRSNLVKEETLAQIAKSINLGSYLKLGSGEQRNDGQYRDSILSSSLEAIFAAVAIDSSVEMAKMIVENLFLPQLATVQEVNSDSKSNLQEYLQSKLKVSLPLYKVLRVSGPSHDPTFLIECSVESLQLKTLAEGKSKKQAQQLAAKMMLEKLL